MVLMVNNLIMVHYFPVPWYVKDKIITRCIRRKYGQDKAAKWWDDGDDNMKNACLFSINFELKALEETFMCVCVCVCARARAWKRIKIKMQDKECDHTEADKTRPDQPDWPLITDLNAGDPIV
jgi:hypothetical protein